MGLHGRLERWATVQRRKIRAIKRDVLPDRRKTLCVLAIMKNESLNIDEWIDHYIWQGADHIYIIDNGSTDDMPSKIEASKHKERITLVVMPGKHQQEAHYRSVVKKFNIQKKFKWLLIVDSDEFCFAKKAATLPEALSQLDWFDVIYMQWTNFGCKDQTDHPKSLRTGLLYRHEDLGSHVYTKWFAKTEFAAGKGISIHKVRGARSARTITANDEFQLNHYWTQSLQFWRSVKMTRGDAALPEADYDRSLQRFEDFNAQATVQDTLLAERLRSN